MKGIAVLFAPAPVGTVTVKTPAVAPVMLKLKLAPRKAVVTTITWCSRWAAKRGSRVGLAAQLPVDTGEEILTCRNPDPSQPHSPAPHNTLTVDVANQKHAGAHVREGKTTTSR